MSESAFSAEELSSLYSSLSAEQRDELLQCLLIAGPQGPDSMMRVIRSVLLVVAAEEMDTHFRLDMA